MMTNERTAPWSGIRSQNNVAVITAISIPVSSNNQWGRRLSHPARLSLDSIIEPVGSAESMPEGSCRSGSVLPAGIIVEVEDPGNAAGSRLLPWTFISATKR
jgi:hypothetical protein